MNPNHPVYVISKGRWQPQLRLTGKALERLGVPYRMIIEPQEFDFYAAVMDAAKILILPFSNLGQGSIPARNWVWDHAIASGSDWHWILDDNIKGFYRLHRNRRIQVSDGTIFRCVEEFCERFTNIAQAALGYLSFNPPCNYRSRPFILNTRCYSCILLRNDTGYRWRGRYNEDTDLSLRMLKDEWCTILFRAFLADKMATMSMEGGNTDELYRQDGQIDDRLATARSLQRQHPDIVRIHRHWGRWQHLVHYNGFKQQLRRKPGLRMPEGPDEYGMILQQRVGNHWHIAREAPHA